MYLFKINDCYIYLIECISFIKIYIFFFNVKMYVVGYVYNYFVLSMLNIILVGVLFGIILFCIIILVFFIVIVIFVC